MSKRTMYQATPPDFAAFVVHMEAMYKRLGQLYAGVDVANEPTALFPSALKELGFAAEELQMATEELQQQNEQIATHLAAAEAQTHYYHRLFNHAPQAQLVTTVFGKILTANKAALRLLRLSSPDTIDRLLIRFIPLQQRTTFRAKLSELQQIQQPQMWRSALQLPTGEQLELVFAAAIVESNDELHIQWTLQEAAALQAVLTQPVTTEDLETNKQSPQISALAHQPRYRYSKGDTIPLQSQSLCYVYQGLVKLTTLTANNEEVLLGLAGAATPFLPGSTQLLTYQATALADVLLVNIPIDQIDGNLAAVLLPKFLQRLQQTEALLNVTGQRRTKDRLYQLLHLLGQEVGEPVAQGRRLSVRLTHEDLANACCTTRVTVTRLLGEMQRSQRIHFDRKFHIVLSENF